jgi:hypothetical protein
MKSIARRGFIPAMVMLMLAAVAPGFGQQGQVPNRSGDPPKSATPAALEDGPTRPYVERLLAKQPVDWQALRAAYYTSAQFDVIGIKSTADRKAVQDAFAAGDFQSAINSASRILNEHYADIDANLACAFAYGKLGKPEIAQRHRAIGIGLLRSIVATKDGKSEETAFEVMTFSEETSVLAALGVSKRNQALIRRAGHAYDRIDGVDRNGTTQTIYFQVGPGRRSGAPAGTGNPARQAFALNQSSARKAFNARSPLQAW